jgi:hypothetical protein
MGSASRSHKLKEKILKGEELPMATKAKKGTELISKSKPPFPGIIYFFLAQKNLYHR